MRCDKVRMNKCYGEMVNQAKNLAWNAHNGQFRKDGETPYILHPARVAGMVSCDNTYFKSEKEVFMATVCAWFHDIYEDC